jgi:AcrR family transcriptional regulator
MGSVPTTDRGRASRQRILDAACDLFYRRGVAATGLGEVIAASGTGKGQLYHYFQDKPDLVRAVIAVQAERTLQAQRELLVSMADAKDLRGWAVRAAEVHEGGGLVRCPLGALVIELTESQPGQRAALQTAFDQWREALATALARLQREGHVRADREPEDFAEILLCAYEGGIVLSEARGDTRSLRLALDAAVDGMVTTAAGLDRNS